MFRPCSLNKTGSPRRSDDRTAGPQPEVPGHAAARAKVLCGDRRVGLRAQAWAGAGARPWRRSAGAMRLRLLEADGGARGHHRRASAG